MKFELTAEQESQANAFLEKHSKECSLFGPKTANWLGTPIEYAFRPCGMMSSVTLRCNCGQKVELIELDEHF